MVFSSPVFLFLFLPLLLLLYLAVRRLALRNLVLLLGSLFFYSWGEGRFLVVLLLSIGANYVFGLLVDRADDARARRVLLVALAFNLGLLAIVKYTTFIVDNVNVALGAFGVDPLVVGTLHLPLGISFFTFQAISYVVDVYRGEGEAQRNPLRLALYISLFPQLVAGPIVRYRDLAVSLGARSVARTDFAEGVRRFVIGLGKKMLIANTLAVPADQIFSLPPSSFSAAVAWLGVVCYALQIYFDFSGYSDMAIGLGRMFGFTFQENFLHPYASNSITEFWRRWHISLSTWFRDYLYIPLGGNRVSRARLYTNLLVVFFLCGLWHGASWTFVVWGLFHGGFLVLERVGLSDWLERRSALVRHGYVALVVLVGWVFFRAATFPQALDVLSAMCGLGGEISIARYLNPKLVLTLAVATVGCLPVVPRLHAWHAGRECSPRSELAYQAAGLLALSGILFACTLELAAGTHNPFLYFRF